MCPVPVSVQECVASGHWTGARLVPGGRVPGRSEPGRPERHHRVRAIERGIGLGPRDLGPRDLGHHRPVHARQQSPQVLQQHVARLREIPVLVRCMARRCMASR